jgi:DNA (cytosine-5)-methyltransferase 1
LPAKAGNPKLGWKPLNPELHFHDLRHAGYTSAIKPVGTPARPTRSVPDTAGQHGRPVLAPAFVEHLISLPRGWITDLALPRTAQLRALGNGVVPTQAAYAVSLLLADLTALLADERSSTEREAAA